MPLLKHGEPLDPIANEDSGPFLCHIAGGDEPPNWWTQKTAPTKDESWLEPEGYPVNVVLRFNKQTNTFEMYDYEDDSWDEVEEE